jgi:hypothetical protein
MSPLRCGLRFSFKKGVDVIDAAATDPSNSAMNDPTIL